MTIPLQRFAGSVVARGAYGLPSIAGYRLSGRTASILALVGLVLLLNALGALDEHSLFLLAGPVSLLQSNEAEAVELEKERDAIIAAAEGRAANGGARGLTDDERSRITAINERLSAIDTENGLLEASRSRRRNAPSVPDATEATMAAAVAATPTEAPRPFASLGEQLKAVAQAALNPHAQIHPGLRQINEYQGTLAATGASELVGADGGFLVQTDLANDLMDEIYTEAVLAPLATTREIGARFNGVKYNVIDETSRATGSRYGGVRFYWVAEGGQKTASRPKLRQEELTLQKAAAMYVATDELLEDTTALESFVRPAFVSEAAFWVDDAMIRGTGAGMPLGVLNSDALITVAKEGGQAADTFLYENAVAMFARLSPTSVRNARWFMNQGVWATLPLLKFEIGTGGVPVWLPPGALADAPFGTLLGRPIEVIEYASAIGDVGDVLLADWKRYLLIRKGGVQQASSIHVYFDTDETAFRWVVRVNGKPLERTPKTPYKGSTTTSPFVTLAAR